MRLVRCIYALFKRKFCRLPPECPQGYRIWIVMAASFLTVTPGENPVAECVAHGLRQVGDVGHTRPMWAWNRSCKPSTIGRLLSGRICCRSSAKAGVQGNRRPAFHEDDEGKREMK